MAHSPRLRSHIVSRSWIRSCSSIRGTTAAAQRDVEVSRRLDDLRLAVLMVDGIDVARHTVVVALGITEDGTILAERYLLYTSADRRLWQAQVHHEPYPLQPARAEVMVEGLIAAAGIERPEGQPPLAHFAREVNVEIFALRDVGPDGA